MANTTLLDVADQRLTDAQNEQSAAATALTGAQTGLAAAQDAQAKAAAQADALESQAASIRQQLAAVPMPADGAALLEQLGQVIVQARAQQAAVIAATDAVFAAQRQADEARERR